MVEASPWPAAGSAAAFTAAVGAVMFMHDVAYGLIVLIVGFLLVLTTMFLWWRDVVQRRNIKGITPIVQIGIVTG